MNRRLFFSTLFAPLASFAAKRKTEDLGVVGVSDKISPVGLDAKVLFFEAVVSPGECYAGSYRKCGEYTLRELLESNKKNLIGIGLAYAAREGNAAYVRIVTSSDERGLDFTTGLLVPNVDEFRTTAVALPAVPKIPVDRVCHWRFPETA